MISCVVLTLNEESDIARCLSSLSWCDDIHILDSGSVDETRKYADGAAVSFSWTTHRPSGVYRAADQRNWALDELPLKYDWVLFVDADEVLTDEFVASTLDLVEGDPKLDAALCAPKFMYHGKWLRRTKKFPTWEPRLVNRSRVRLMAGSWERLPADTLAGRIAAPYLHYANSKGLEDWVRKHLVYARWEADQADPEALSEGARGTARKVAERAGFARPFLVYLWFLIARGAFWEGAAGRSYARRMFIYELLIRERIAEDKAVRSGLPL